VLLGREIDVLGLGEEAAAGLGLDDVDASIRRVLFLASLVTAATLPPRGVGFVGLVVPHIARAAGLRRHRSLLIERIGATLVVVADLLRRILRPPAELPLGAVTALVGVPFFLLKLRRLT
jgi:iron complex transport system permease protein